MLTKEKLTAEQLHETLAHVKVGGGEVCHYTLKKCEELVPLMQAEGFAFHHRWGPSWNYTATFERQSES